MQKKSILRTLMVTIAMIVCGLLASGASDMADNQHAGRTLHVLFHPTSYKSTQADPTGSVFASGDEIFLGGTILRFESPDEQIGTVGLHCSATGAEGSELLCEVVFTLQRGKIAGQTLFNVQGEWLNPTRKLAITGGTGAYRNAAGEITVTALGTGDEKITFKFGD
jgi:hypothetical protein